MGGVDGYGVTFHYPVDSELTIDDVLIGFERNIFNSDMAVVNDACLVSYEFAVFIAHFSETHISHGEVLIVFVSPFILPDVDVANNFYAQRMMSEYPYISNKIF